MNAIEKNKIDEIITLHNELGGLLKMSIEKAIRIGELLTEQKAELKHGEFTAWIEANLPFTDRTARNYMHLYNNRVLLKTETVSDLSGAYRLLESNKPKDDWRSWLQVQKIQLRVGLDNLHTINDEETRVCTAKLIYDKALWLTQACAEILFCAEASIGQFLREQERIV